MRIGVTTELLDDDVDGDDGVVEDGDALFSFAAFMVVPLCVVIVELLMDKLVMR